MKTNIDTTGMTGRIITREDLQYEESREMWNRAIEKYPLLIVYCKNSEDVRNAILWAKTHKVGIRIRSGRHHYEGYSTGNDVMIIDVSGLNEIEVNETSGDVTIGGGVRNREIYEALGQKGYAFPGGGCPTVGVAGFALGGGWGYSCRLLGLGCDFLKEVVLIDAEGQEVIANEKSHQELFWALRGSGGGQFGVVVRLTFNLPPKKDKATLLRLEYHDTTLEEQIQMYELWQEQLPHLCPEVNFKLSFYHSKEKGRGMLLLGIYYGEMEEAQRILEPFKRIGRQLHSIVEPMSVLEVNRWIQDAHPDYEHYKSSGRFVNKDFTRIEIEELLSLIEKRAEGAIYTALSCYGLGGAVAEKSKEETAFYYRDSKYIMGFQSVWEDNTYSLANKEWFLERFKKIEAMTEGSFVNFPLAELAHFEESYYGEHAKQLRLIKKQYDANGIFSFPQSITLHSGEDAKNK